MTVASSTLNRLAAVAALPRGMLATGLWAVCGMLLAMAPCQALEGKVVRVTDGDSLWLKPADGGRSLRVRLQGMDAPEICQPGGPEARRALEKLVLDQPVRLTVLGRDDHGRTLARVQSRGTGPAFDVGARLVLDGRAWSYRYRGDAGPYQAEEKRAVSARLGLHAQPGALLPRDFRLRHGPCR